MLVGLISDTHDKEMRTRQVLEAFKERGVERVLHAGDVTSNYMIKLFDGFDVTFAIGNMDDDIITLSQTCKDHGFDYKDKAEIDCDGLRIGLIHGDDENRFRGLVESGAVDVVVHGHTHRFRDTKVGKVRVINPGAMTRSDPPCAAVLDTESGELERILL